MAENEKINVARYAEHRGISRQRVYKYIRLGKLSKAVVIISGKTRIDRDMADHELSENLDQVYNPPRNRAPAPPPDGLALQEQAVDIASVGEQPGPGYITPWPLWAARYIGALAELAPDRVMVEQITKTEWRVTVHDLDAETGEPLPWTLDLVFDFSRWGAS